MKVEAFHVCHFRNFTSQTIIPSDGVNEFVGQNAQGKTALLEALHVLVLGGSFRTYQLRELIQHGTNGFFIEAVIHSEGVRTTLAVTYDGVRRYVTIDGQPQESSSQLLGHLLGVTATLEDHELIFGPPAFRRRFLDEQIAQVDPFYVGQLCRYSKALAQRNRLLKLRDFRTIGAWEELLAKAGAYIASQRRYTAAILAPKVASSYRHLFEEKEYPDVISMRYLTQCPESEEMADWYRKQYAARREHEARAAATLVGPHRDDIEWCLGSHPCKAVASLGQARAVALALRCAEWELLSERSQESPLFLIDDVESTLDGHRKETILELCQRFGQVFFTGHQPQSSASRVMTVTHGCLSNGTDKSLIGTTV
jgi:DNA replication and repair protein RecF